MKSEKNYNLIFSKRNKYFNKQKNILIGRWLTNYEKNKTENIKDEIYEYHWLDKKKKLKDSKYIKKVYLRIIKNVVKILNRLNNKRYNKRQWELIIGHFLHHFIFFSYDRWKTICNINNKYKLNKIDTFIYNNDDFIPHDTEDFFDLLKTEDWDNWIISEIITIQNINSKKRKINFKRKQIIKKNNTFKDKLLKHISSDNKAKYFLKNLGLPKKFILNLHFKLNQTVHFYNSFNIDKCKKNFKNRKTFRTLSSSDKFEDFIYKTLPFILPTSFFENFKIIEKNLKFLNWPQNPRIIITAYDHYLNEIFKVYTAEKIKKGSKFFILQHGHQGHTKFCLTNSYEKRLCDKYFTWGNKSKGKDIPLFITTNINKTINKIENQEGILISFTEFTLSPWKQQDFPREIETNEMYKTSIINFFDLLNKNILKKTTAKYYSNRNKNFILKDLKKKFTQIKYFETNKIKRGYEISGKYKLLVETTNSTGFIESLSMNIPVILVTKKDFFTINDEYKKYYNALIKANLIFFDSNRAAKFVNSNLNDIEKWWSDKKRQKAINFFCTNMCRHEKNFSNGLNLMTQKIKKLNS